MVGPWWHIIDYDNNDQSINRSCALIKHNGHSHPDEFRKK